jgi:hypothetical protein
MPFPIITDFCMANQIILSPNPPAIRRAPRRVTKFKIPYAKRYPHRRPHLDDPHQMPNFQQFFRGYLEVFKSNLQQVSVMGQDGKERYRYNTCGQEHDRRNPAWMPFQHLSRYCQELGYDFCEARDLIEERIGRKLICECEILK